MEMLGKLWAMRAGLAGLCLAGVLVLAGCGDDEPAGGPTGGPGQQNASGAGDDRSGGGMAAGGRVTDENSEALRDLGDPRPDENRTWTLLLYMVGDNDLEAAALADLNELEAALPESGVEVIALVDRAKGFAEDDGDWTGARVYRIRSDDDPNAIRSEVLAELPKELNCGRPETLQAFLVSALVTFPSKKTALFMWNHGGGWSNCANDMDAPGGLSGTDELALPETQLALSGALREAGRPKFDLLVWDMCLMGQLDVAVACKDAAEVMIFSEALVPVEGLPYDRVLPEFTRPASNADLAKQIVRHFGEFYQGRKEPGVTLSAIDCSKVDEVTASLDALSAQLRPVVTRRYPDLARSLFFAECYTGRMDYRRGQGAFASVDLMDALKRMQANVKEYPLDQHNKLVEAINNCVIVSHTGPDRRLSNGLAVYAPVRADNLKPGYADESHVAKTNWLGLLSDLHSRINSQAATPEVFDLEVYGPDGKKTGTVTPFGRSYCKFTVDGTNILWITWQMVHKRSDDWVVSFKTFHVVPGEARQSPDQAVEAIDLLVPKYKDGRQELYQEIGGVQFKVVSGNKRVSATLEQTDPGNVEYLMASGKYSHPTVGEDVPVDIFFDTDWWVVAGIVAYVPVGDGTVVPRQIEPKPDAKVTFYEEIIGSDGKSKWQPGGAITWGKGPELIMEFSPTGPAAMRFEAESISGRSDVKQVAFAVKENTDLTRHMKANPIAPATLKGTWGLQALQMDPRTGQPAWADAGAEIMLNPSGGKMLDYAIQAEGKTAKGSAHLETRGLPLLSVYVADDRGKQRRAEAFIPIYEKVDGFDTIVLRDLNTMSVLRLVKGGTRGVSLAGRTRPAGCCRSPRNSGPRT